MSKNFFLISFLPAVFYWYLESYYEPKIAAIGGVLLAGLELLVEKFFVKHIHSISKANFFLIFFLGALSFIDNQGIWFKLQPAITGIGIGVYLLFKVMRGKGLLFEMMESINDQKKMPPLEIMQRFETHVAIFFLGYGLFMGGVAFFLTTGQWTFFKTLGFYIVSIVFFLVEVIWLRIKMKKWFAKKNEELFKKF
jgi:intracellular septation protein